MVSDPSVTLNDKTKRLRQCLFKEAHARKRPLRRGDNRPLRRGDLEEERQVEMALGATTAAAAAAEAPPSPWRQ